MRTVSGGNGFYPMRRGWLDDPLLNVRKDKYDRRSAWVWLLENARYQDGALTVAEQHIPIKRGQLYHSVRFMAKAWGWDEKTVRNFLRSLNSAARIRCGQSAGQNLITICNYDEIMSMSCGTSAEIPQELPQFVRSSSAKKKEGKEGKEREEVKEASPLACASPPPVVDQPPFEAPKKSHQGDLLHTADVVHLSARDVDKVLARWNVMVKGLPAGAHIPAVRGAAGARERAVRKALREGGGLEGVDVLFGKVAASKFLNGQGGSFSATFDWVFAGGQRGGPNYQKIMEGNYDREFTAATRKRGPDLSYLNRPIGAWDNHGNDPDPFQGTTIDMPLDGELEAV